MKTLLAASTYTLIGTEGIDQVSMPKEQIYVIIHKRAKQVSGYDLRVIKYCSLGYIGCLSGSE